jgi:hypothetical protein
MSHYFDDILHRHSSHGHGANGGMTPRTPSALSPTAPRLLRRSSTSRSLAARSDYSVNGDYNEDDGDDAARDGADTPAYGSGRRGSVNREAMNDPERVRARAEADAHLHSYISQQLERVRLERAVGEEADEIEASP